MEKKDENPIVIVNNIEPPREREEIRTVSIYGPIGEKLSGDAVSAILYLSETAETKMYEDPENPESDILTVNKPIDIVISTMGGSVSEMFSIYDTMRYVKSRCDISTFGVGKIMSAGVLLLAAGTKGKRKIGANCRVMIHGIAAGAGGSLRDIENEVSEIKWIQRQYINCLNKETKMTKKKIREIMAKQIDVYFSAQEAVEFGIADEIV